MICAFSYVFIVALLDYLNPEGEGRKELGWDTETSRSQNFWVAHLIAILPTFAFTMMMLMFFDFAITDAVRRNEIMTYLSQALEMNLHKKNQLTLQLPVFNFFDPPSLVAWANARNLALGVGSNYANRIKVYSTVYISTTFSLNILFFLAASGIGVEWTMFSLEIWLCFGVWAICLNLLSFKVLYPLSYLNEKTSN